MSRPWNITQQLLRPNYQYTQQIIFRELCWVKNNLKRLHILYYSIYKNFLKSQNYRYEELIHDYQGRKYGWERSGVVVTATWGILVVMKVLCILTVSILIYWLWYYTVEFCWLLWGKTRQRVYINRISPYYCFSQKVHLSFPITRYGKPNTCYNCM